VQLLSPWGGLVAVAVLLPVGALALAARRVARLRRALRLGPAPAYGPVLELAAVFAAAALLAGAATQPTLVERKGTRVRTDAQALVVVDTSASMLARSRPGAPTRFDRARTAAVRIRGELSGIETGLATMTDRVLPDLLPVGDSAPFDTTVARALAIDSPPPREATVLATSLGSLADIAPGGFFAGGARHRVLVVLTDGESRPYDEGAVAASLESSPSISLVLIRFGGPRDRVFVGTKPDPAYRADPGAGDALAALARITGGKVFGEGRIPAAGRAAAAALGSGPAAARGQEPQPVTLAPWLALAALLPFFVLALRRSGTIARSPTRLGQREWRAT
jgi:von Willebrand factor type A domain